MHVFFAISVYGSFAYALTVKYTLGSSNYQSSSSHGNSSTNMGNERGELLWDRERERIKKKEKEKEIAAKMAVRLILKFLVILNLTIRIYNICIVYCCRISL